MKETHSKPIFKNKFLFFNLTKTRAKPGSISIIKRLKYLRKSKKKYEKHFDELQLTPNDIHI